MARLLKIVLLFVMLIAFLPINNIFAEGQNPDVGCQIIKTEEGDYEIACGDSIDLSESIEDHSWLFFVPTNPDSNNPTVEEYIRDNAFILYDSENNKFTILKRFLENTYFYGEYNIILKKQYGDIDGIDLGKVNFEEPTISLLPEGADVLFNEAGDLIFSCNESDVCKDWIETIKGEKENKWSYLKFDDIYISGLVLSYFNENNNEYEAILPFAFLRGKNISVGEKSFYVNAPGFVKLEKQITVPEVYAVKSIDKENISIEEDAESKTLIITCVDSEYCEEWINELNKIEFKYTLTNGQMGEFLTGQGDKEQFEKIYVTKYPEEKKLVFSLSLWQNYMSDVVIDTGDLYFYSIGFETIVKTTQISILEPKKSVPSDLTRVFTEDGIKFLTSDEDYIEAIIGIILAGQDSYNVKTFNINEDDIVKGKEGINYFALYPTEKLLENITDKNDLFLAFVSNPVTKGYSTQYNFSLVTLKKYVSILEAFKKLEASNNTLNLAEFDQIMKEDVEGELKVTEVGNNNSEVKLIGLTGISVITNDEGQKDFGDVNASLNNNVEIEVDINISDIDDDNLLEGYVNENYTNGEILTGFDIEVTKTINIEGEPERTSNINELFMPNAIEFKLPNDLNLNAGEELVILREHGGELIEELEVDVIEKEDGSYGVFYSDKYSAFALIKKSKVQTSTPQINTPNKPTIEQKPVVQEIKKEVMQYSGTKDVYVVPKTSDEKTVIGYLLISIVSLATLFIIRKKKNA